MIVYRDSKFFFFDLSAYFIVVVYFLGSCDLKGEKEAQSL